jgi:hypothetical protein
LTNAPGAETKEIDCTACNRSRRIENPLDAILAQRLKKMQISSRNRTYALKLYFTFVLAQQNAAVILFSDFKGLAVSGKMQITAGEAVKT